MREFTGSELAEITGKSWRTVQKRLSDAGITGDKRGTGTYFPSATALEAIFAPEVAEGLDLAHERAALAQVQRERIELELAESRGELVRVQDVLDTWAGHIGAAKQALLGLPAKAAGQIAAPGKTAEAEAVLRRLVKELLTELADSGQPRKRGKAARRSGADVEATTGSDGERVGG